MRDLFMSGQIKLTQAFFNCRLIFWLSGPISQTTELTDTPIVSAAEITLQISSFNFPNFR